MQQMDDPPSLPVGTEVSAKYKGAFCEAKVSKVVRNIKVKVAYKQGLGSGIVSDDAIKAPTGQLRVGAVVEVRHPDRKELVEATITKIQDCSQYTVVFDDGDITTLRRTALCLKSGRHFNESKTLDQLPLTHPEQGALHYNRVTSQNQWKLIAMRLGFTPCTPAAPIDVLDRKRFIVQAVQVDPDNTTLYSV
ncbi:AT-rich interactive domain-containing protein 4A isoform X2 [Drosophila sechellia]|uniref:AT-rich interactive domain-containing protein 4A isoform X2 n=1 Tax=Drosophila sechellia TaxID=7238 RepID=UPI0013DE631C|nr:AT-rich interactive domain-containing protein 4A isoform X2 [Drosophila sechellia]